VGPNEKIQGLKLMLILADHRHDVPALGTIELKNDRLIVCFKTAVTREEFFSIFGNVGFIANSYTGETGESDKILRAEILEFSLTP
jgi:hypothetical protein